MLTMAQPRLGGFCEAVGEPPNGIGAVMGGPALRLVVVDDQAEARVLRPR
jgi:hypothetical protein